MIVLIYVNSLSFIAGVFGIILGHPRFPSLLQWYQMFQCLSLLSNLSLPLVFLCYVRYFQLLSTFHSRGRYSCAIIVRSDLVDFIMAFMIRELLISRFTTRCQYSAFNDWCGCPQRCHRRSWGTYFSKCGSLRPLPSAEGLRGYQSLFIALCAALRC